MNKNKARGNRWEYQYLDQQDKIFGYRFYESVGPIWRNSEFDGTPCFPRHRAPIDTFYVDRKGVHFVQNKYGERPFPDTDEMLDLLLFAMDVDGLATVELATKYPRQKPLIWVFNNKYL